MRSFGLGGLGGLWKVLKVSLRLCSRDGVFRKVDRGCRSLKWAHALLAGRELQKIHQALPLHIALQSRTAHSPTCCQWHPANSENTSPRPTPTPTSWRNCASIPPAEALAFIASARLPNTNSRAEEDDAHCTSPDLNLPCSPAPGVMRCLSK